MKRILISLTLVSLAVAMPTLLFGETIRRDFSFGPGTPRPRSHYRTLYVPPKTSIGVAVELNKDPGPTVPVIIEVRQASANSLGNEGPDGPLLDRAPAVAGQQSLVTFTKNFSSNFGCPNSWRVRVKTQTGHP